MARPSAASSRIEPSETPANSEAEPFAPDQARFHRAQAAPRLGLHLLVGIACRLGRAARLRVGAARVAERADRGEARSALSSLLICSARRDQLEQRLDLGVGLLLQRLLHQRQHRRRRRRRRAPSRPPGRFVAVWAKAACSAASALVDPRAQRGCCTDRPRPSCRRSSTSPSAAWLQARPHRLRDRPRRRARAIAAIFSSLSPEASSLHRGPVAERQHEKRHEKGRSIGKGPRRRPLLPRAHCLLLLRRPSAPARPSSCRCRR